MLVCAATLAALTLTDHVTPTVLLALTFALGVGAALMGPAWQAIQPDLVPAREFGQAVALSSLTFNTGRAIGPALAGALVASAGAGVGVRRQRGVVPRRRRGARGLAPAPHRRCACRRSRCPAPCGPGCATASTRRRCAGSSCARSPSPRRRRRSTPSCRPSSATSSTWALARYGVLLGCFGIGAVGAAVLRPRIDAVLTMRRSRHGVVARARRRHRRWSGCWPSRGSRASPCSSAGRRGRRPRSR